MTGEKCPWDDTTVVKPRRQPKYWFGEKVAPLVGDFKGQTGTVNEIVMRPHGIEYGLIDIPLSWGKMLYYKEVELP